MKGSAATISSPPLDEFGYGDVTLASDVHEKQLAETHALLMGLSEDSLLKPFRQMVGQPAPGEDLGGWYQYAPDSKDFFEVGFAPGCTFGQWVSALARSYVINRSPETRETEADWGSELFLPVPGSVAAVSWRNQSGPARE